MKKRIALILSLVMAIACLSVSSVTAFAAEPEGARVNEQISSSVTESGIIVQPRTVEVLKEIHAPFWPDLEFDFTLNAKRNLKLLGNATHDCTLYFYKGNSIIPFKVINLEGGADVATYDIKDNCSAGNYSVLVGTEHQECSINIMIVSTEYT